MMLCSLENQENRQQTEQWKQTLGETAAPQRSQNTPQRSQTTLQRSQTTLHTCCCGSILCFGSKFDLLIPQNVALLLITMWCKSFLIGRCCKSSDLATFHKMHRTAPLLELPLLMRCVSSWPVVDKEALSAASEALANTGHGNGRLANSVSCRRIRRHGATRRCSSALTISNNSGKYN